MSTLSMAGLGLDNPVASRGSAPGLDFGPASRDESIADLVRRHGAALSRFLLHLTRGDRERAEDIYQETLIRAWRHPECREDGGSGSRPWLFTVARRISIDQHRAATARPAETGDIELAVFADPVDHIERVLLAGDVRAAVMTLSPSHREVLQEIYFQDRPVAEVAERLGIPAGTVKSRTYYALRALKNALAERGLDNAALHR